MRPGTAGLLDYVLEDCMQRKTAFTLIELLVVISIIAVLAATLFPVFAAAKGASKRTAALNNVGQLGKSVQMYLNDYDDHLPSRFPMISKWPGYNAIVFVVSPTGFNSLYGPYIKDTSVWFSPEDRLPSKGYTSFAFNEQLSFEWAMSEIPRPAEAIYFTDRTDVLQPNLPSPVDTYVWWQFTDQTHFTESSLPGQIDPVSVALQIDPIRYTGNVAIYSFLDTHAASMPFERTWGDATHNLHLATKS